MSRLTLLVTGLLATGTLRQMFVLSAIARSCRFLRSGENDCAGSSEDATGPVFFLMVPVLREAAVLEATVGHLDALARGHLAQVVVVTAAREAAEASKYGTAGDSVQLARDLAAEGKCVHLHYPDPCGVKGDQLNYAAAWCASALPPGDAHERAFVVCYDADSRPPANSLACFEQAIAANPGAEVFHQSSRFELRSLDHPGGTLGWLRQAVCDAGALRANRFVLGFEIPRLINRTPRAGSVKRAACSRVYAHVTGHGLCVRLSLLARLPFPAKSPLEDMHYSFILCSRGLPMIPVASVDRAEVPGSVSTQVQQAARWFFGPARIARYLRDPATRRGWRTWVLAASAVGSAVEWLGCALVPALVLALLAAEPDPVKLAAAVFIVICTTQVVLTEIWLGSPQRRAARILAFPLACAVHGTGGTIGLARLLRGGSGTGKTERAARR
jgi:glycosyl transferase family 2